MTVFHNQKGSVRVFLLLLGLLSVAASVLYGLNCGVIKCESYLFARESQHKVTWMSSKLAPAAKRARGDEEDDQENQEVQAMIKNISTSMAKLFQQKPRFDPLTHFSEKWPRPPAPQDSATPLAADTAPYAVVADTFADISSVGSRLECTKLLTQLFWAIIARCPQDLLSTVYVAVNKQAPAHEGVELGIGDAILVKVVAECCSMTEARVKELYQKTGDLAEVAQNSKKNQATLVKPKPLTVQRVFRTMKDVALMSGKDVVRRRGDAMKSLLRDAKGPEVNFLVRAFQCKMRMGLAEPTVLVALGYAFALQSLGSAAAASMSPEALQIQLNVGAEGLARVYHEVPSLDIVVEAVLTHGFEILNPESDIAKLHKTLLSIRPGLPVRPQLAQPTNGITTILNRFQGKRFTCEYKYDGERAQIHYRKGNGFQIFSRNSETHTTKYPDVIQMMPSVFNAEETTSFIIDAEVVAVDENGSLQAFQVLQHRGRKNIDLKDVTIHVCIFAFDIMYYNDAPVLHKTLTQRRELLASVFTVLDGKFRFAQSIDSEDTEEMQRFLEKSIVDGCEGLMVKTLDVEAEYTPAKRSRYWLKLKKDYMEGATDTLDLVAMGAYFGKGKRTGVFGGFLLGCYDAESDEYQSVCKIGTGFSDDMLESLTETLTPLTVPGMPQYYRTNDKPDVWLTESQVWEVRAADLSISPVHFGGYGLVDPNRGIALRFPRFLRVRDDKGPTNATSAQQVADMYRQQSLALSAMGEEE
jgi:DNA ligase 1